MDEGKITQSEETLHSNFDTFFDASGNRHQERHELVEKLVLGRQETEFAETDHPVFPHYCVLRCDGGAEVLEETLQDRVRDHLAG